MRTSVWLVGVVLCTPFLSKIALAAEPKTANADAAAARETVNEALQRETYGLVAERNELLQTAIEANPQAALPRWYLGQIQTADGTWVASSKPLDAGAGQLYREYRAVRESKADDAQGQKSLADWCVRHGLKQQERVHLLRSLAFNPQQADVRQRLGLIRIGQQWYEPITYERLQSRAKALRDATVHWHPIFTKLAPQLSSPTPAKRQAAEAEILAVKDPLALPALQVIVGVRSEREQELILRVCERLSDPLATELLAWQAAESPSARLRQLAAQMLAPREMCDYVPLLAAEMYTPVQTKLEAKPIGLGGIFVRQSFYREGADRHELLVSDDRFHPNYMNDRANLVFEPPGREGVSEELNLAISAERTRRVAERSVALTEAAVAEQNRLTIARNERIAAALAIATGNNLGAKPDAWWKWWTTYTEAPITKGFAAHYQSNFQVVQGFAMARTHSCLAAGTPIATDQGPMDVEKLLPGDLVLARDIETGELAYKPVIQATVRDKSQLLRITAGKDTFEATGGHLFWVSGQGWVRARDLKPGQVLHAAGEPVTVLQVDQGLVAEAYNLVVADYASYFVGREQILSHDISPRRPTNMIVPGLRASE